MVENIELRTRRANEEWNERAIEAEFRLQLEIISILN
jgi:hypothetical protein